MPTDRVYDSVNLLPYLTGQRTGEPHDRLYWRAQRGQWAVRASEGSWKIVRQNGAADQLYRLSTDLAERTDLAAAEPARLQALAADLAAWNKQLIPPAFPGLAGRAEGNGSAKKKKAAK
jgi:hypothetical protein